ncbi:hypothetical protein AOQ84DRAFT_432639 [Glonium stellatum]|uniref:Uncharacterized protein n=1 Tax=Glonium stellatum TaxID=574774 RepID=A0A8E2JQX3_9PEZI|nr:hypothetical protein AOQ84DRAFT_432639 [Glonium stellatum]
MASKNLLLPIKLDAFVLNPAVCNGQARESKIAPITQPNYTYLRVDQNAARTDVLPHVDLHLSSPSNVNPRITNLSTRQTRLERQGVYLHWTIPRIYRSGSSSANDKKKSVNGNEDPTAPVFPAVPNRWLVVRKLHAGSINPKVDMPEIEAWVVESDRVRRIDELNSDVDLQNDVSPFMDINLKSLDEGGNPVQNSGEGSVSITDQAEVFIGMKFPAATWSEDKEAARVKLHLLASSNQLFADYQPHNGNVFSILDNFIYNEVRDAMGKVVSRDRLKSATADYYVIGWHSDDADDVLYTASEGKRRERLAKLSLALSETLPDSTGWLDKVDKARIVCHGAMYGVNWNDTLKPATPADDWSSNLNQKQQISIGTTPIDALLAYVSAHHGEKPSDDKKADTGLIRQLEEDIHNLAAYLRVQDESVEAYRKATDQLIHRNYSRSNGGTRYTFPISQQPGKPTLPSDDDMKSLRKLNTIRTQQWELFSLWFKYFSTDASAADARLKALLKLAENQLIEVNNCKNDISNAVEAVASEYHQQRDPTLLVGGVKSGWAHDFLDKVKVRLDTQLVHDPGKPNIDFAKDTIKKLLGEFCALGENNTKSDDTNNLPMYHDTGIEGGDNKPWRDRWNNMQPWFPLFVEWEAEYVHVPWQEWKLKKRVNKTSGLEHTYYGINPDIDLTKINDKRVLSGRILVLPQPSFSLEALIQQLFDTVPETELNPIIDREERDKLLANVRRLSFLSAPMSGLTDHLLTLARGTHIKPTVRATGKFPQAISEAVDSNNVYSKERIGRMDLESDPTPYGMQIYVRSTGDNTPSPFKPVTHGQLRFTKLNIIDKFGQAIHALQPTASAIITDRITPCVSEFYETETRGNTNDAHTASADDKDGFSEFVQLPPSINQPARLNAYFVKRESNDPTSGWRPASEWENPIWGWIVVNYIDYGIQLFTAGGVFYREVRLPNDEAHGRTSGVASATWLPFKKTELQPGQSVAQLDRLIQKLTAKDRGEYLQAFLDMINGALKFSGAAPGEYAESLNCIVGKPLALVNMGWSLELSTSAYTNQSTMNVSAPSMKLLGSPNAANVYQFPIKIGDSHREFDGLVGYFPVKRAGEDHILPLNDELDLTKLYTYFGHGERPPTPGPTYPILELAEDSYPKFQPYWLDPQSYNKPDAEAACKQYVSDTNSALQVFGAIIDPFQPIHAYSSFLPIRELKLPDWTWQQALNHMTAFFHIGPLMVTKDVPDYNDDYELKANLSLKGEQKVFADQKIELPTNIADWNWLQPYMAIAKGDTVPRTTFMPIALGKADGRPKFEDGPYTAVEGYLQMTKGILEEETKK